MDKNYIDLSNIENRMQEWERFINHISKEIESYNNGKQILMLVGALALILIMASNN